VRHGHQRKQLLSLMSPQLQGEVCMTVLGHQLESVPFLRGAERELILLVGSSLEPALFAPGELTSMGNLYIIQKGVALYGGQVLTSGKLMGQDMILRRQSLCHLAARAMSYLEVYCISRAELIELARPFPIASSVIRWAAFRLALIRTMVSVKRELKRQEQEELQRTGQSGEQPANNVAFDAWKNLFDLQHSPADAKILAVQLARNPVQRTEFNPNAVDERPSLGVIKQAIDALREDVAAIRERQASCYMTPGAAEHVRPSLSRSLRASAERAAAAEEKLQPPPQSLSRSLRASRERASDAAEVQQPPSIAQSRSRRASHENALALALAAGPSSPTAG